MIRITKSTWITILKIVVAVATAILGVIGASTLVSCSVSAEADKQGQGIGVFHYTDSFVIDHSSKIKYPK